MALDVTASAPAVPRRIQRSRVKGWRIPEGAVYVGRPTRWGNPWRPGQDHPWYPPGQVLMSAAEAVSMYERHLLDTGLVDEVGELQGKDLVCWCPLEDGQGNPVPCHADVLLRLANGAP